MLSVNRRMKINLTSDMGYFAVIIFKALIIDRQKLNHKQFNQNNKEVGFYKFYYQLILNMFAKDNLESNTKYIIHLDKRKTSYKLEDLKFYLNMGFSSKFKTIRLVFISNFNSCI